MEERHMDNLAYLEQKHANDFQNFTSQWDEILRKANEAGAQQIEHMM
jgi:hypothetical protein